MDDLLFYDAAAGEAEFCSTDGQGGLTPLGGTSTGWRTTWNQIVPAGLLPAGDFFRGAGLLFYDAGAGEVDFWISVGNGRIVQGNTYTGQRTSWTDIVPGNFDGSGWPDFLFYDADAGEGQFCSGESNGELTPLGGTTTGWRKSWTRLVPGKFGGSGTTDLLCYDAGAGETEFWVSVGDGVITQLGGTRSGWRATWNQVVPGNFGGGTGFTDLLFYDADAGEGEFYSTDGAGGLSRIGDGSGGWRTTWTRIVPGNFGGGGTTDLLCYDADAGEGEFWAYDGNGRLTQLGTTRPGWRATWSRILPGNFSATPPPP